MVKFASACQLKLQQLLVSKLAEQLGEDTKDLALRVGIHSGPITGGILRGDRGRFQLFGDVSVVQEHYGVCIKVTNSLSFPVYTGRQSTQLVGWNPMAFLAKSIFPKHVLMSWCSMALRAGL